MATFDIYRFETPKLTAKQFFTVDQLPVVSNLVQTHRQQLLKK